MIAFLRCESGCFALQNSTLLPCKTAAFAMQNNRICKALVINLLCNRYSCEKCLCFYSLFSPIVIWCKGEVE